MLGSGSRLLLSMYREALPVTPRNELSESVTMLSIAPTPSASSRAPGSVITSIFLMEEAGMAAKMSLAFLVKELLGRPFL